MIRSLVSSSVKSLSSFGNFILDNPSMANDDRHLPLLTWSMKKLLYKMDVQHPLDGKEEGEEAASGGFRVGLYLQVSRESLLWE